jgi:undecaprenyl diphosphate synthase
MMTPKPSLRPPAGLHVAIIMDGNGRWALARGLRRTEGHAAGARAVRRAVEAAPALGIATLTVYAFSSDNWHRPSLEVSALMRLFRRALHAEVEECLEQGVRVSVIGRRDRLDPSLCRAIDAAERVTAGGRTLHLRIAIDYSARDSIVRAASGLRAAGTMAREDFTRVLGAVNHAEDAPDVDLLVRTGGEQRLSDFLRWESAYAELIFLPCMWPDFDGDVLARAVAEYHSRDRRFGRVAESAAVAG